MTLSPKYQNQWKRPCGRGQWDRGNDGPESRAFCFIRSVSGPLGMTSRPDLQTGSTRPVTTSSLVQWGRGWELGAGSLGIRFPFNSQTTQWGRHSYYSHVTDETTEAQRGLSDLLQDNTTYAMFSVLMSFVDMPETRKMFHRGGLWNRGLPSCSFKFCFSYFWPSVFLLLLEWRGKREGVGWVLCSIWKLPISDDALCLATLGG